MLTPFFTTRQSMLCHDNCIQRSLGMFAQRFAHCFPAAAIIFGKAGSGQFGWSLQHVFSNNARLLP